MAIPPSEAHARPRDFFSRLFVAGIALSRYEVHNVVHYVKGIHNEAKRFITCVMKHVMKLVMKLHFITVT